jgi:NAD(P) transhydrogenase subunit beta
MTFFTNEVFYYTACTILTLFVLFGIYLMSKVETARAGNSLSAIATLLAIIITILHFDVFGEFDAIIVIIITFMIGSLIGVYLAYKVKMIQMPEMVALLNGVGGGASALVGIGTLIQVNQDMFTKITAAIAVIIGMVTLTGSLVAAGKLAKYIKGKPIIFKYHSTINTLSIIAIIICAFLVVYFNDVNYIYILLLTVISGWFGVSFSIRVGGADMPITISLLNSLSGVAGAIAGMAINDVLLVAVGGIVGSSGLVLTQIMCKAMNRNLTDILLGKTSVGGNIKVKLTRIDNPLQKDEIKEDAVKEEVVKEEIIKEDPYLILKAAKKVIVVPGYGMALAQAQSKVKELLDLLEKNGASVKFAIHPVAGRMPGHMNVLLAEVDVDYDKLYEMDNINDEFKDADVTIVIGANDVLNPAARNAEGTPIYGMPILNVDQSKFVIICNYDTKPGYAGVDNPLYTREKGISLMLGDAKETLSKLIEELKK